MVSRDVRPVMASRSLNQNIGAKTNWGHLMQEPTQFAITYTDFLSLFHSYFWKRNYMGIEKFITIH